MYFYGKSTPMSTYYTKIIFTSLFFLVFAPFYAQQAKSIDIPWVNVTSEDLSAYGEPRIKAIEYQVFRLNTDPLRTALQGITYREGMLNGFIASVSFTYANGTLHPFTAKRNQTMHPAYNAKFPELITLDAYATDGSGAYGKWDITPAGLHAMIFIPGQ